MPGPPLQQTGANEWGREEALVQASNLRWTSRALARMHRGLMRQKVAAGFTAGWADDAPELPAASGSVNGSVLAPSGSSATSSASSSLPPQSP